ncbi:hypothetical protein CAPTEDRAFT_151610 [Capitella teleta]|uniref:Thioredoxin domain-containing protein n=1 Tax=Capitella teleta TaxID=283909 RepID=R7TP79_CAPTE|nr:hypothetical protein CAPTEDRAFT_151610 [Capitella teleta]|eukprot:ELT95474.1 hypothetical protein CAPTEDRAFT_151610 [Capitella teleta]
MPTIVMFYAPWCGHCKRLSPTFDELAEKYNIEDAKSTVVVAKVDCTQEGSLCKSHGVTGYPTIKFFHKETTGVKHTGPRDLNSLVKFVETRLEAEEVKKEEAPSDESKVLVLTSENFDETIETGSYFVKFYAPWCGHCKRLAPQWETFASEVTTDDKYSVAKVDCTVSKEVCQKQGIRGYPTLVMFINGEPNKYEGQRNVKSFKSFAVAAIDIVNQRANADNEKIPDEAFEEEAAEEEEAEEGVLSLTESSFDDSIAKGTTFVKFFAPWCGHCKRLAPTWDQLATKFAENENVKIAKVDCTIEKTLCSTHSIRGFPTLVLFSNGAKVKDHSGGRDLEALAKFINSNSAHDEL